MKSRILHTSYVIDFLNVDFNSNNISDILKLETDKILEQFNFNSLNDWEVFFKATYGKRPPINIYKKFPSYKNEKQKWISIHIPIPTQEIVDWGVKKNQHINMGIHPNAEKYVNSLDLNYYNFSNRTDYILDCMRRAIKFCFEDGFTVNGVKVKIPK